LYGVPIFIGDSALVGGGAGSAPTAVVLQPAANFVGLGHVVRNFVKLANRDLFACVPRSPRIAAEVNAAVAAHNHVVGIGWIDPDSVEVNVDAGHAIGDEGLATVFGIGHVHARHPNSLIVVGIDAHLTEIHGPRVSVAHSGEVFAFVVAAINSRIFAFNERINYIWIFSIDVQTDAAHVGLWQAIGQLLPVSRQNRKFRFPAK